VKNQPLRIVLADPSKQPFDFTGGTVPNMGTTLCETAMFSVTVNDPDLKDHIGSYWYIDQTSNSLPFRPSVVDATGQVSRTVNQPNSNAFKAAMGSMTTGTHLLTVYVTDTDFQERDDGSLAALPTPRLMPDGSEVLDPGYIDSYTWVLRVGPACQQ